MRHINIGTKWFLLLVIGLAVLPWINDSRSFLIIMTQICIFAVFAMSYDILLGYTGIVSFGHCMFFGIGAYATGVMLDRMGASIGVLLLSIAAGVILSALLSYLVGMLSLRLKNHFYAMLTLAFSGLLLVLAEKWRSLTRGNDGFTFPIPSELKDRTVLYMVSLAVMVVIYMLLRRFTQSPVGRVLVAIRENEQRTASLGYEIIHYKVFASVAAGVVASISGSMYVLTLRFVNTTVFAMDMTLNALLMTIIGGVGTLFGAIIGSAIIEWAHHGLTELAKFHPIFERWIIFFGLLYIVVVLIFPAGITGTLRMWWMKRRGRGASSSPTETASRHGKEEAG
ncbi:branched-chain amino acid ABC transporter permease [Paenibacillus alvei]|uniref:branched-chain amino acid ABC transporter permease n=1 Tax=Paenibacillus alvei TaxID=44250 RepID=UPI00038656BB|nr:branched-chain amino acid ABC transporter permease [Paenibacillus alvei]EPY14331.1 ABC transporter permease [Paenibacillus alvei A6-6i-x]